MEQFSWTGRKKRQRNLTVKLEQEWGEEKKQGGGVREGGGGVGGKQLVVSKIFLCLKLRQRTDIEKTTTYQQKLLW